MWKDDRINSVGVAKVARKYIIQSWGDAAAYSGSQIGNRLASSEQVHFLPDGQANIGLYKDDSAFQKDLKLLGGVEDKLDKLDELELELHRKFVDGEIGAEDLERHLVAVIKKRDTFFKDTSEQKKIAQLTKQYETIKEENKKTLDTILKMEDDLRQQEKQDEITFLSLIKNNPWLILIVVFILGKIFS